MPVIDPASDATIPWPVLVPDLMDQSSTPNRPLPPGLDARAAAVLREIVEQYVETGEPVGSRTLSRRLPIALSPATIRNVMADLTEAGLLFAPHTSAGRLPTERGLRLFVDGLLQFGDLGEEEREAIARALDAKGRSLEDTLAEASTMLSGLAGAAGLVLAPKIGGAGAAYRVRGARLGPRAGDAGRRGRAGREPGDRDAARPAALRADRRPANYLNARALRPHAGRAAPHRRRGDGRRPLPARRAFRAGGGGRARDLDAARAAAAS